MSHFQLCDKFGASGLCMLWTILFECLVQGSTDSLAEV